jgi:hypothetical protein
MSMGPMYSQHPKNGQVGFSNSLFKAKPDIIIPGHLKTIHFFGIQLLELAQTILYLDKKLS